MYLRPFVSPEAVVVQDLGSSIAHVVPLFFDFAGKESMGRTLPPSSLADTDPVRTATGLWIGEAADYDYDNPVGGQFRTSSSLRTCLTRY